MLLRRTVGSIYWRGRTASDTESHTALVQEMIRILQAQRILPMTVLFELADHLESLSRAKVEHRPGKRLARGSQRSNCRAPRSREWKRTLMRSVTGPKKRRSNSVD